MVDGPPIIQIRIRSDSSRQIPLFPAEKEKKKPTNITAITHWMIKQITWHPVYFVDVPRLRVLFDRSRLAEDVLNDWDPSPTLYKRVFVQQWITRIRIWSRKQYQAKNVVTPQAKLSQRLVEQITRWTRLSTLLSENFFLFPLTLLLLCYTETVKCNVKSCHTFL